MKHNQLIPTNHPLSDSRSKKERRFSKEESKGRLRADGTPFRASFRCDGEGNEIFTAYDGAHALVMRLAKPANTKHYGVIPTLDTNSDERLLYRDVKDGTDCEYSLTARGIKETVIVKKPRKTYRYRFLLECKHLVPSHDEEQRRIFFLDPDTENPVFCIPSPYMQDADGALSQKVHYTLHKTETENVYSFSVVADPVWMNAPERVFPIKIDPTLDYYTIPFPDTYAWCDGELTPSTLCTVGTYPMEGESDLRLGRMYFHIVPPNIPTGAYIKKAELTVYQESAEFTPDSPPLLGLYDATEDDESVLLDETRLLDYAKMKEGQAWYRFDITSVFDRILKEETERPMVALRLMEEGFTTPCNTILRGDTVYNSRWLPPEIHLTYESALGINTASAANPHSLGFLGESTVDLVSGALMLSVNGFSWAGNRMPVTLRHGFHSSLAGLPYTASAWTKLKTADFSSMKLGHGFRINAMQSMIYTPAVSDNSYFEACTYIDENGEVIYLTPYERGEITDEFGNVESTYVLCENQEEGLDYNSLTRTLTKSGETHLFDEENRLIRITDESGNTNEIVYEDGRISYVSDGAGRIFSFVYDDNGFLTSVTAPDASHVNYGYTGELLSQITYPDGRYATITYADSKPSEITLFDADGTAVHRTAYTFTGQRVTRVEEYGSGESVGIKTDYDYSASAGRTRVTVTDLADTESGEATGEPVTTVYVFDDEGNLISEYMDTHDDGRVGIQGDTQLAEYGNNLLKNHTFTSLNDWDEIDTSNSVTLRRAASSSFAYHGTSALMITSASEETRGGGVSQTTDVLPSGTYTFSAYFRISQEITGEDSPGAFLCIKDESGSILNVGTSISSTEGNYVRTSLTFALETEQSIKVQILVNGKGTVYADAAQLEQNSFATPYNLLGNGSLDNGLEPWESETGGVSFSEAEGFHKDGSLCFTGNLEAERSAYRTATVSRIRSTRETFLLSGWAKGNALPIREREGVAGTPTFRLRAVIKYSDSEYEEYGTEEYIASFSPRTEEWQYASVEFSKNKYRTVHCVQVYCDYDYNVGSAYFDDLRLIRTNKETGLTEEDFSEAVEEAQNTDVSSEADSVTKELPDFEELKDAYGNNLTETLFEDGQFGALYRSFAFTENGNDLREETDARGFKTRYEVDAATSRNKETTDRCSNQTAYEYDMAGRISKVTSKNAHGAELANVSYAYDAFDNMTEIVRGDGLKYALRYNAFHNLTSIGIDGMEKPLIKYTYKNGSGRLKEMTYANGHTMKATYNAFGQMVTEKWFATEAEATDSTSTPIAHYKYVYDGDGNIVRSLDICAQKEYNYVYDKGALQLATASDFTLSGEAVTGRTALYTVKYTYDAEGTLTKKVITSPTGEKQTVFLDTNDDRTVVKVCIGNTSLTSHSGTDSFGRKSFDELQIGSGFLSRRFDYVKGEVTETHLQAEKLKSSPTTQLVKSILFSDGRTLSYEYDAEERITRVEDSIDGTTEYTYDALGQLLCEKHNGHVINSMEYDGYGNIVKKNGKAYTYGDPLWKDLLTSYDGKAIEYDAEGNPASYLGHTLTWEKGRQLKSFDDIAYTYNANGIRTSKTVGGIKHEYALDGTKILCERWDGHVLIPLYDNEESVCGIHYDGIPYYFQKNLGGDVIAIADSHGKIVARYLYDAWGVCTILSDVTGVIARVNPFRYRSYYFDSETSLYYLQSRYYDANVGRFINADVCEYLFLALEKLNSNLFTYCNNNAISNEDINGYASKSALKRESWIAKAIFKFIPNVTYSIREREIWSTPKWLGAYLQLSVGMSTQSNANGIIGFGFSRNSFDVGISVATGKTSTAVAVGATWTESYIVATLIFSSRYERIFYAINFKLAIKHWLVIAAAILCAIIPQLAPIGAYAAKLLCASARAAKPILMRALPRLLGV